MVQMSVPRTEPNAPPLPWWMTIKVNALPLVINCGRVGVPHVGARLTESELRQFIATAMSRLKSQLTEANVLDPVLLDGEESELHRLRDEVRGDVDILVPLNAGLNYNQGWRSSTSFQVRLDVVGKPVLRLHYMVWDFAGLEVIASLKAQGVEAYFAATWARANQILRRLRVRKALKQTKIAVVGPVASRWDLISPTVPTNVVDPAVVRAKTGVEVAYLPVERLQEIANSVPLAEAEVVARGWTAKAREIKDVFRAGETGPEWMTKQARLYLGIKRLMSTLGFTAFSGCAVPGSVFGVEDQTLPCFAFTNLKDEGIPCGCEGDQNALLAMIMLMYLAGKPADVGNTLIPTYTDDHMEDWMLPTPGPNVIGISHSVTPTRMAGYDQPADGYSICGVHCSTCYSINGYVELPAGQEVTIARLGPQADRMLIAEGVIDSTHMTPAQGNRNAVYIRVKDRDAFIDRQSEFGNHLTFVYGRVGDELSQLCQSLRIEPVFA